MQSNRKLSKTIGNNLGMFLKSIRQHERIVLVILLITLFLSRIAYMALNPLRLGGDATISNRSALDLLAGKGYWWAGWRSMVPPLYSLFLASIYKVFGYHPTIVCVIQAIFDVLTAIGIFIIAKKFFKSPEAGFITIGLMLIYPPLYYAASRLFTFSLFTMLMVYTILLFLIAMRVNKLKMFILVGILLGVASLCRGTAFLLWIPMLVYALFVWRRKDIKNILLFVVLVMAMFITMTPWALRNYKVHGKLLFTSTNRGLSLWVTSAEKEGWAHRYGKRYKGELIRWWMPEDAYERGIISDTMPEIKCDAALFKKGLENIKKNPRNYIFTVLANLGRLYLNFPYSEHPSLKTILFALLNLVLITLAASWFWCNWRKSLFLGLYIAYFTIVHILLNLGHFWYAIPMMPLIFLLASLKVVAIVEK